VGCFYLGVDGGQSSTVALVGDQSGAVLGLGRSGPCNHVTGPEARTHFDSAIGDAVAQACRAASLDPPSTTFAAACLGFSGGTADKENYTRALIRANQLIVTHDAAIALSGAIAGEPGIITISGTGSMIFGRNSRGVEARAGGWGYVYGDEGSGFDLTRQALRAALRHEEGWGPQTVLRDLLLRATGAASVNDLLHRFYTPEFSRPQIAALSVLVSEAAEQGDREAERLLFDAATQLVNYVEGVHHCLFDPGTAVPIAYSGGVFKSRLLLREFVRSVHYRLDSRPMAPIHGPAAGALIEALRLDGNLSALSGVPQSEK
jgi:N-acetylglucosamine kinase-like BadF-type ATPase